MKYVMVYCKKVYCYVCCMLSNNFCSSNCISIIGCYVIYYMIDCDSSTVTCVLNESIGINSSNVVNIN